MKVFTSKRLRANSRKSALTQLLHAKLLGHDSNIDELLLMWS